MNQKTLLYVNGQMLDLYDESKEPIQIVMQANDLGDITSVSGNSTKQFNVPLTKRNKSILGFPGEIYITAKTSPYNYYPAKLVYAGIEIIPNGKLWITKVTDKEADVMVLCGNCDMMDLLGGQLADMGDSTTPWSGYGSKLVWKPYDHIWNVANAAYSQEKTEGWIYPVINYGGIGTSPPTGFINVRNQRPAFFVKTAIELLIQSTGYTIDKSNSCLYNDTDYSELYNKMLVPFSNSDWEHGTDFQNAPDNLGVTLLKGLDQVISNPRVSMVSSNNIYTTGFPFEGVISFGPADHYAATTNVNFTATILFNIYIRGRVAGKQPTEVIIKFTLVDVDGSITDFASSSFTLDNGYTIVYHDPIIGQQEFVNQNLSQDFSLVTGQKLYCRYHINNIGTDPRNDTYAIFRAGATFSVVTSEKLVLWEQPVQCERIFPDISQIDLLKFVLQTFGLMIIANPNTGTVIFGSYKKLVNNIPIARDWSEKALDMGMQVQFNLGNYAQFNWLRYQQDDSIPLNLMPRYFADDFIGIPDKTLNPIQPVQDLFMSLFAPTLNVPFYGGTIAQINNPAQANPTEFSVGSQPRILIDQKLDLQKLGKNADGTSISVTFADNDPDYATPGASIPINGKISVPYFYKPDGQYNLCWCDQGKQTGLKNKYYSEFANVLKETKSVVRYFYLTPMDIQNFDFMIPVYVRQDGCYYYVNKIDSYVPGQPCKIELIKIS